jgi:hypothetical protein
VWDSQLRKTQSYGLWINRSGRCVAGWVEDNNLLSNGDGGARFDTPPSGGCWDHNHGLDDAF